MSLAPATPSAINFLSTYMVCSVAPHSPLLLCPANPSLAFAYNSILSRLSPVAAVARLAWQIDSILDARLADNSMDPLPQAGFSLIFFFSSSCCNQDRLEVVTHTHTHVAHADPGVETEAENCWQMIDWIIYTLQASVANIKVRSAC